jgi:branched-chain amino acid transport system permease protein
MIKQKPKNTILSIIAIAALLVILELIGRSKIDHYYIRILQYWSIYIIYGASFQLLYGYTGLLSLGHAGLIAIGAYVVGIFTISPATKAMSFLLQPPAPFISNVQIPFIPALIIGGFFAALFGLVVAAPALRLGGDYLAIVTMGFAEVIRLAM